MFYCLLREKYAFYSDLQGHRLEGLVETEGIKSWVRVVQILSLEILIRWLLFNSHWGTCLILSDFSNRTWRETGKCTCSAVSLKKHTHSFCSFRVTSKVLQPSAWVTSATLHCSSPPSSSSPKAWPCMSASLGKLFSEHKCLGLAPWAFDSLGLHRAQWVVRFVKGPRWFIYSHV